MFLVFRFSGFVEIHQLRVFWLAIIGFWLLGVAVIRIVWWTLSLGGLLSLSMLSMGLRSISRLNSVIEFIHQELLSIPSPNKTCVFHSEKAKNQNYSCNPKTDAVNGVENLHCPIGL